MFSFQRRLQSLVLSTAPDLPKPIAAAPESKRKFPLIVRGIPKDCTCPEDLQQLADGILRRSFRFFPGCQRFVDRVFYCLHVDGDMAVLVFLSELMAELLFCACRDESTSPFFIAGKRFTLDRSYIQSEHFGNSESKSVAYLTGIPEKWQDPQRLQSHFDSILEGDFPSKALVASVEARRWATRIVFTSTAAIDRLFHWIEQDPRLVTDISPDLVMCSALKLVPLVSSGGLNRPAKNPSQAQAVQPSDRAPQLGGLLRQDSKRCATKMEEQRRNDTKSQEQPSEGRNQRQGKEPHGPAAWEADLASFRQVQGFGQGESQHQVTLLVSLPKGEICPVSKLRQVIAKGLEKAGLDESGIAAIEVTSSSKLWQVVFKSEAAADALMTSYIQHTPDFCLADLPLAIYRHRHYVRPGVVYRDGSAAVARPRQVTLAGVLPTLDPMALRGAVVELIHRALAREAVLQPWTRPFQNFYWKKGGTVASLIMDETIAEKLVVATGLTLAGYIVTFYYPRCGQAWEEPPHFLTTF